MTPRTKAARAEALLLPLPAESTPHTAALARHSLPSMASGTGSDGIWRDCYHFHGLILYLGTLYYVLSFVFILRGSQHELDYFCILDSLITYTMYNYLLWIILCKRWNVSSHSLFTTYYKGQIGWRDGTQVIDAIGQTSSCKLNVSFALCFNSAGSQRTSYFLEFYLTKWLSIHVHCPTIFMATNTNLNHTKCICR